MSSVTSECPSRSRKQPERAGMIAPSPDSRRRVSIDSVILASGQSPRHKKKNRMQQIEDTEDESDVVQSLSTKQKRKTASTKDVSDSESISSAVAKQKKRKRKATQSKSGSKEVC
ncbi:uncharacterized protein MELLADRAFT_61055 [Melampsora larici-populina 98AG31]|uniref:Uncharacterized protein n=1 Tax=Melampsora larici-populina (strain 98AG31 / pathotype 3-4-7) TaxID=747676 RepID=F4RDE9_MELLP|nr:uncharacterized protein MELLADRAFT_61055 [Melampsora larici-populina 98AG31]EGG09390.1 hypothetical protein MELLADRAFT_61055 [Melampsora larici-populina 98AG31]